MKSRKNLTKLTVLNKNSKKFLNFSNINLLFGYNKSGKTTVLERLNDIFVGKDRNHYINGTQTIPDEYDVIFLSSNENIKDHIKLSSKSLVRRLFQDNVVSSTLDASTKLIQEGAALALTQIEQYFKESFPNSKVEIKEINKPINFLIDNLSISLDLDTTSQNKEDLFSLIDLLVKQDNKETIVLIDDFCNDLDEESTIKFFNKISKIDAVFFLTTSKSIPQYIVDEEYKIFAVREDKLIEIPPLSTIILEALSLKEDGHTFEEYMLGNGYIKESYEASVLKNLIKYDQISSIIRILTSKNPIISDKYVENRVTIIPRTEDELKIYRYVFDLLELDYN